MKYYNLLFLAPFFVLFLFSVSVSSRDIESCNENDLDSPGEYVLNFHCPNTDFTVSASGVSFFGPSAGFFPQIRSLTIKGWAGDFTGGALYITKTSGVLVKFEAYTGSELDVSRFGCGYLDGGDYGILARGNRRITSETMKYIDQDNPLYICNARVHGFYVDGNTKWNTLEDVIIESCGYEGSYDGGSEESDWQRTSLWGNGRIGVFSIGTQPKFTAESWSDGNDYGLWFHGTSGGEVNGSAVLSNNYETDLVLKYNTNFKLDGATFGTIECKGNIPTPHICIP